MVCRLTNPAQPRKLQKRTTPRRICSRSSLSCANLHRRKKPVAPPRDCFGFSLRLPRRLFADWRREKRDTIDDLQIDALSGQDLSAASLGPPNAGLVLGTISEERLHQCRTHSPDSTTSIRPDCWRARLADRTTPLVLQPALQAHRRRQFNRNTVKQYGRRSQAKSGLGP
jgi:hypothetical protein